MSQLSNSEVFALGIVNKVVSGLSILFCAFAMLLYKFSGRNYLNSLKIEIIFWLLFSVTIETAASAYIPIDAEGDLIEPSEMCLVQTIISTVFSYSHYIWNAIIAYVAFIHVLKPEHLDQNKWKYRIIFLSLAFGIPLIMALM